MNYYIRIAKEKRNTAGAKAPEDIYRICESLKMKPFVMRPYPAKANRILQLLFLVFSAGGAWLRLFFTVRRGDVVIYQHPMYAYRLTMRAVPFIRKRRGCRFIALIHDLESLRGGIAGVAASREKTDRLADTQVLGCFDRVICHNEKMKTYLADCGISEDKLVPLGAFDYLTEAEGELSKKDSGHPSVAIAGNLAPGKCMYIYHILDARDRGCNRTLTVHLYGINFDEKKAEEGMVYHGSFTPEELPAHLAGDFGLVWDGPSAETCEGNTGNYLRWNNPHKLSLYLASGLPVVVWSEAATADFVRKNGVGICVSSLYDLERRLEAISPSDYAEMCANARAVGEKMRRGGFFKDAFAACVSGKAVSGDDIGGKAVSGDGIGGKAE